MSMSVKRISRRPLAAANANGSRAMPRAKRGRRSTPASTLDTMVIATIEANGDVRVQTHRATERRTVRIPLAYRPAIGLALLLGVEPGAAEEAARQLDSDAAIAVARTMRSIREAIGDEA